MGGVGRRWGEEARHCERSEAIQSTAWLDCRVAALLAMTVDQEVDCRVAALLAMTVDQEMDCFVDALFAMTSE